VGLGALGSFGRVVAAGALGIAGLVALAVDSWLDRLGTPRVGTPRVGTCHLADGPAAQPAPGQQPGTEQRSGFLAGRPLAILGVGLAVLGTVQVLPARSVSGVAVEPPRADVGRLLAAALPARSVVLAYPYPSYPDDQAMPWQAEVGFGFSPVGGYVYQHGPVETQLRRSALATVLDREWDTTPVSAELPDVAAGELPGVVAAERVSVLLADVPPAGAPDPAAARRDPPNRRRALQCPLRPAGDPRAISTLAGPPVTDRLRPARSLARRHPPRRRPGSGTDPRTPPVRGPGARATQRWQ